MYRIVFWKYKKNPIKSHSENLKIRKVKFNFKSVEKSGKVYKSRKLERQML